MSEKNFENSSRIKCYKCMRPSSSCMCEHLAPVYTETHFVILMHPMEYKREKNGTGRLTHLQLKNSQIIVGVNFAENQKVNDLLNDPAKDCFILYPGQESINLSSAKIPFGSASKAEKMRCIFIIDGTWACAKKMLKLSTNLHNIKKLSFDNSERSNFHIKQQPDALCLSTIESTFKLINLLISHKVESCDSSQFLLPFEKMVEYQIECVKNPYNKRYRANKIRVVTEKNNYKKENGRNIFF